MVNRKGQPSRQNRMAAAVEKTTAAINTVGLMTQKYSGTERGSNGIMIWEMLVETGWADNEDDARDPRKGGRVMSKFGQPLRDAGWHKRQVVIERDEHGNPLMREVRWFPPVKPLMTIEQPCANPSLAQSTDDVDVKDKFAAAALTAILTRRLSIDTSEADEIASQAWLMSEAMMRYRNRDTWVS